MRLVYNHIPEPLESDLERQVEYDMDEQGKSLAELAWLDALNAERQKRLLEKIPYEVFEVVIDRLEKEWFNLISMSVSKAKLNLKPELAFHSDDSCAICDELEGENNNAIVFCDGCNVAVHQADCYGVPYIPEGQWLCRPCSVSPGAQVSCILCPNSGGAFKQTAHGEWIHLLCAIWVPETFVSNEVFMEPVIGIEDISKQRWKLKCSICTRREGACIQCVQQSCFLAFHVTCARKSKLLFPMRSTQGSELRALACFCERHLPVCFSRPNHFWH
ncbi:PHD-zinc-finger like domain-containing protein [Mycena leptocephala]|nr:PHD-zinc-finger like domain-containing protein [Mycena leptocephala]